MKPILKAVPYLRVSEGDLSRQKSLDDQLDEARQFASDEGVEIVEGMSYVDDGISGRSVAARPALKQLLEDAQSGRLKAAGVSVVLCWGVDRLGRNQREALNVVHALNQCGIELMTVRERCNTGDPGESKMSFAMEAMIAESYSETLGALARRGHQDAAHKGRFWAPTPPYGYRRVKGGIEPDPKESELVREVFRLFLEGRSRHGIARLLKERKTTKRGGSLDWSVDEITRMLTSDAVIGVRVYKGVTWDGQRNVHNEKDKSRWIVTPNAHESLIELDTFVRAQRLIRDRKSNLNFNTVKKYFSLLGGIDILACGKCGGGYNSMIGPKIRMRDGMKVEALNKYYACGRRSRHGDCQGLNVRQEVLDRVILQRIAAYVKDTDAMVRNWKKFNEAGLEKLMPLKGKLQALDAEIAQLDQKQVRFIDAYGTGDMPKALFSKHLEDVGKRLRALKTDRRALNERMSAFDKDFDVSKYLAQLAEFNGQFEALPPESRKMLLTKLIKKITINGPYEFVIETTFLPEPVSFPFGQDYEPPLAPALGAEPL